MTKNDEQNDEVFHLYTVKNDEDDEEGGGRAEDEILFFLKSSLKKLSCENIFVF